MLYELVTAKHPFGGANQVGVRVVHTDRRRGSFPDAFDVLYLSSLSVVQKRASYTRLGYI